MKTSWWRKCETCGKKLVGDYAMDEGGSSMAWECPDQKKHDDEKYGQVRSEYRLEKYGTWVRVHI